MMQNIQIIIILFSLKIKRKQESKEIQFFLYTYVIVKELNIKTNQVDANCGYRIYKCSTNARAIIIPKAIVTWHSAITTVKFQGRDYEDKQKIRLCNFVQAMFLKADIWESIPQVVWFYFCCSIKFSNKKSFKGEGVILLSISGYSALHHCGKSRWEQEASCCSWSKIR